MFAVEVVAYSALVAAIYGTFRVGRRRGARMVEPFEWARVCVLGMLVGILIAIQVRIVSAGIVRTEFGIWAGAMGVVSVVALVALDIYEFFEARNERAVASVTSG